MPSRGSGPISPQELSTDVQISELQPVPLHFSPPTHSNNQAWPCSFPANRNSLIALLHPPQPGMSTNAPARMKQGCPKQTRSESPALRRGPYTSQGLKQVSEIRCLLELFPFGFATASVFVFEFWICNEFGLVWGAISLVGAGLAVWGRKLELDGLGAGR